MQTTFVRATRFRTAMVTAAAAGALLGMAAPVSAAPYVQDDPIDCDATPDVGFCPALRNGNLINPQQDNDPGGEVSMSIQRSGLTSVVATFQNTSTAAGNCHYDAQDVIRHIAGQDRRLHARCQRHGHPHLSGAAAAFPYHATVVCNGTFMGLPIEFGNASQNVSG